MECSGKKSRAFRLVRGVEDEWVGSVVVLALIGALVLPFAATCFVLYILLFMYIDP